MGRTAATIMIFVVLVMLFAEKPETTEEQLKELTDEQINGLTGEQIKRLTPEQVVGVEWKLR